MTRPVYAVLLNYNGWRDTIECLESLLRSSYENLRVVVLDNGSTDGSMDRIRDWARGGGTAPDAPGVLRHLSTPPVIKPVPFWEATRDELERGNGDTWADARLALVDNGGNIGFAAGNNVALRHVLSQQSGAYAFMLNNDTVIGRDAISQMVALATSESDRVVVGAKVLQYHRPERVETLGGATVTTWHGHSRLIGWDAPRDATHSPARIDFLSGCCMLIPRDVLDRVGLMDERFFLYCEDADWGVRARAAGLRLVYAPRAEVWHKAGATAVHRSEFHDYHNVRSVLHFVRKHRPLMLPVAAVYLGARSVAGKLLRRDWRRLRAVWRGYRDFVGELVR